jgi:hypothetical protein
MIGIMRTLHADLQITFRLFMFAFLDDGHYALQGRKTKPSGFQASDKNRVATTSEPMCNHLTLVVIKRFQE